MSLVPEDIKKTVGFIFRSNIIENEVVELHPLGTGFFIGVDDHDITFTYFVTAKHVIHQKNGSIRDSVWIRLNRKIPDQEGNETYFIRVSSRTKDKQLKWFFHPDVQVDLAVLPLTPNVNEGDFKVLRTNILATQNVLQHERVTEGDELFFAGLLPQYFGNVRNYPVLRFGRLALLTDEPYRTPTSQELLYFAECHSYPGQSGSPVFLRFTPIRRPGVIALGESGFRIFLLGVMKGHFKEHIDDRLSNVGIAAIIPADLLQDVLYGNDLLELRKKRARIYENMHW